MIWTCNNSCCYLLAVSCRSFLDLPLVGEHALYHQNNLIKTQRSWENIRVKKLAVRQHKQCYWEFMFIITLLRASLYFIMFCLSFIFSLQVLQNCNSVMICIQVVISLFLECQSSLPAPSSGLSLYSFLCAAWTVHIHKHKPTPPSHLSW